MEINSNLEFNRFIRTNILSVLMLFLASILNSCYEPSGTQYIEVDPTNEKPDISIDLKDYEDTIVVTKTTTYFLNIATGDKDLNYAEVYIDDEYFQRFDNETKIIAMEINPNDLELGAHKMTIKVMSNSKTGSLADSLGYEGYKSEQSWTLIILDNYRCKPVIKNVDTESGTLDLEWDQAIKELMIKYYIYRWTQSTNWRLIDSINSPDITNYKDDDYIGEQSRYKVNVQTVYGDIYESNYYNVDKQIPELRVAHGDSRSVFELEWDKTPFTNAFYAYRIQMGGTTVAIVTDPDSLALTFDEGKFGINYECRLTMISQTMSSEFTDAADSYSSTAYIKIGEETPVYGRGVYANNYLYYLDDGIIKKYDININEVIEEVPGFANADHEVAASPGGKYMLISYVHDNFLYFINPKATISPNKIMTNDILGSDIEILNIAISDKGIGVLKAYDNTAYIYDFVNNNLIAQGEINNYAEMTISSDGKYIISYSQDYATLYQIENEAIISKNWFDNEDYIESDMITFLPGDDPIIWSCKTGGEAFVANLESMSKTKTYDFPSGDISNVDATYGRALIADEKEFSIIDINTGELLLDGIMFSNHIHYSQFFLVDSYIYWFKNIRLKVL